MAHYYLQAQKTLSIFFWTIIILSSVEIAISRPLNMAEKRTLVSPNDNDMADGQLEQIFDINNRMDARFDEYPMVVPKRAALLLDRLMVALHRALEKERADQRKISEMYGNKSIDSKIGELDAASYNMYSDDDPSVVMDYDFKDLNSVNRATGETLLPKSFQRRANLGFDLSSKLASGATTAQRMATLTGNDIAGIVGVGNGGGRNAMGSTNRMYWRCYFNAVSCF